MTCLSGRWAGLAGNQAEGRWAQNDHLLEVFLESACHHPMTCIPQSCNQRPMRLILAVHSLLMGNRFSPACIYRLLGRGPGCQDETSPAGRPRQRKSVSAIRDTYRGTPPWKLHLSTLRIDHQVWLIKRYLPWSPPQTTKIQPALRDHHGQYISICQNLDPYI